MRECDSPAPEGAGAACEGSTTGASVSGEACVGEGTGTPEECGTAPEFWIPEVINAKVDGQGSNVSLVPGDWFSYKLAIDLPGIPSDQPKMIKIELLTNDPVSGKIVALISQSNCIQLCQFRRSKQATSTRRRTRAWRNVSEHNSPKCD